MRRISEYFHRVLVEGFKHVPSNLLSLRSRRTPPGFPSDIVSPIFPIFTEHPLSLAVHLGQLGYPCRAISYPMVPRGEERLRVIVHAANQPQELVDLVSHILGWAETMQGGTSTRNPVVTERQALV